MNSLISKSATALRAIGVGRHKVDKFTVESISLLLKSGFSIHQIYEILDLNNIFAINNLNSEDNIDIERIFISYLPNKYASVLNNLLKVLPLSDALSLTIEIIDKEDTRTKILYKNLAYPVILIICMIGGLFLFSNVLLPSVISLLNTFQTADSNLFNIAMILNNIFHILLYLIVFFLVLAMYAFYDKNKVKAYLFLNKIRKNNIFEKIISEKFANLYRICLQKGLSTKETVMFIKGYDSFLMQYIGDRLNEGLEEGKDFLKVIHSLPIDDLLKQFVKVSVLSLQPTEVMEAYIELMQIKINNSIKTFSKTFQTISYICFGFVVILVYQILTIPMQMIQNLNI